MKGLTYKSSGVDIEAGYEVVKRVKKLARSTFNPAVASGIGFFGGCYSIDEKNMLVSATDGVGTKLKIAFKMNKHDTVGIDLVAMNVNDVICCGAKPLFFLDYIGVHKLDPDIAEQILKGIVKGCKEAGCALIGGETAELPGLYNDGEYDLAGFVVGMVQKKDVINGSKIKPGDKILGLASSGIHSNGYSLVRRVFFCCADLDINEEMKGLDKTLGEELLTPTRIYTKTILNLIKQVKVKGVAHITGGGLPENVARLLPKGTKAHIERFSWKHPSIFGLVQMYGRVGNDEMYKTFNMGIGMVIVVEKKDVDKTLKALKKSGEEAFLIGEIQKGSGEVEIK
ncbi:phosphoribosylformylglycinamidine cyclo-ligase [candidate division WOR-1 bacterium RIFOXYA2_FULL_36_21]|uniref:Phosphoribosylformylglycinamidine cyclo-ligase n=1 Tax=candidate division WOR-1 bacterium RIFOXYB2_FULL_36_35 TaxID=1802578 RepID=A0A1F4S3B2_UNCSA|nr:MAG: phosphoribosylformylglycinamidine cyclo-ligase [candidate division WOR-1 bacterium RIFOXYA2_FULL_36_21]OGC14924.1 MAG: phosphoribosylformylglycinamidine cyclo-ligase [candidate division WOR-1 bacterium RIFOXYB2_FULL_36_35]OGC16753.1 MAG: phosphoribosylformylglycinamidine cyclo-ligase [candidate division WOR-1 bacterium RIFOXYA12_FULL_36_13]